jgi:K+-sensing histidine kinase KdpD
MLDADFVGMASVIPFRRSHDEPMAQPSLRLVPSVSELPKTAVIACLTANSFGNSEVLRKARHAAQESDGEFYAVLVDSPHARFGRVQSGRLLDDVILASYFGAKIVWLKSADVVGELIQFGRQSRVGRIFIARSQPRPFLRAFGRSIYSELLSRAEGFRIEVIGFDCRN